MNNSIAESDVEKDIHIALLKDTLNDLRKASSFKSRIIVFLSGIILICIISITSLGVYYQNKFVSFVQEYDVSIENTFSSDNSSTTENNSVSVTR